jgi:UDP-glucose 4-epimerase
MSTDFSHHFRNASALVTGGAGFIGSHIARRLVGLGANVRIIDSMTTGLQANIPKEAKFYKASILDDDVLREAASGCHFIFHKAALVSVPLSVEQPMLCAQINITGTERVLEAAKDLGVKRVVFASSGSVYGGDPRLPSHEDDPVDPWSPYAASKAAGEVLCAAFAHCYDMTTVCLRYLNVFGPRQNPDSPYAAAIASFIRAVRTGKTPTVFGDGLQTRDFVHVDNVVNANLLAATNPAKICGERFNIGTGVRTSVLDVLNAMGKALGRTITPNFGPPRAGDVLHSGADISRAREKLEYEPLIDFETGMKNTLRDEGVLQPLAA